jgi:hypothetical protein
LQLYEGQKANLTITRRWNYKKTLNIPSHIFGEHKKCKERDRTCKENRDKIENDVPNLKLHGLYQQIESAIMHLSAYSDSLLLNLTNNPAESFNSIICKEIGGKRIHFGKRGSYNARIAGAVVQHNTQQVLTQVHESVYKDVLLVVANLEKRRQIKVAKTRESREINGKREKYKQEQGTDSHYGPKSQRPDFPANVLKQLEYKHMEKLIENAENRQVIERETRGQSRCELWQLLRREMLTASNFATMSHEINDVLRKDCKKYFVSSVYGQRCYEIWTQYGGNCKKGVINNITKRNKTMWIIY